MAENQGHLAVARVGKYRLRFVVLSAAKDLDANPDASLRSV
jgi:hypothetical protein